MGLKKDNSPIGHQTKDLERYQPTEKSDWIDTENVKKYPGGLQRHWINLNSLEFLAKEVLPK